jgi:hypothetical protein
MQRRAEPPTHKDSKDQRRPGAEPPIHKVSEDQRRPGAEPPTHKDHLLVQGAWGPKRDNSRRSPNIHGAVCKIIGKQAMVYIDR